MTMTVQGPGGISVQFPDGTDAATIDQVMRQATAGQEPSAKGDRLPMAPGAVLHDMPADTVQGGPPPSDASDVSDVMASRYQAGLLDIPGQAGDAESLLNMGADWVAGKILGLAGKSPEQIAAAQQKTAAVTEGPLRLPTSQGVKDFVGFKPYVPQTDIGRTVDKWGGGAIELLPSVLTTGGASILKKGVEEGVKAGLKKGTGDVLKQAVAPAVASEAAGEATKGTPYEVPARLLAAVVAGKGAGATRSKVTGALTGEQWQTVKNKFYGDMTESGVVMNPEAYAAGVDRITAEMKLANFDPDLHKGAAVVLKRLEERKGTPKTLAELDQLHQLANEAANSPKPREVRMGSILADKIDNMIRTLKPTDLVGTGDPRAAANALLSGRDAYRRMRTGEMFDNMIARAKDSPTANNAAGLQAALQAQFNAFKWAGTGRKAKLTPQYERLSNEEKLLVNGIIGGNKALQIIGKVNFRNPIVAMILTALGATGSPLLAGAALGGTEAARAISAAGTLRKATQLGDLVRGGQRIPGRLGRTPNAIFYGSAAQRETDRSKQGGQ